MLSTRVEHSDNSGNEFKNNKKRKRIESRKKTEAARKQDRLTAASFKEGLWIATKHLNETIVFQSSFEQMLV